MPKEYLLELVKAKVAPADKPWESSIHVRDGHTLPFIVERGWSGPAGSYVEHWSIRRGGREVIYQGPTRTVRVWSMQAITEFTDHVDEPIELEPGTYQLVFVVEGRFMGARDIEVTAVDDAAA